MKRKASQAIEEQFDAAYEAFIIVYAIYPRVSEVERQAAAEGRRQDYISTKTYAGTVRIPAVSKDSTRVRLVRNVLLGLWRVPRATQKEHDKVDRLIGKCFLNLKSTGRAGIREAFRRFKDVTAEVGEE